MNENISQKYTVYGFCGWFAQVLMGVLSVAIPGELGGGGGGGGVVFKLGVHKEEDKISSALCRKSMACFPLFLWKNKP